MTPINVWVAAIAAAALVRLLLWLHYFLDVIALINVAEKE